MLLLAFSLFLRCLLLSIVRGSSIGLDKCLLSWVTTPVLQCFDATFSLTLWKSADFLRDCLRSIFGSLYLTFLNFTQIAMSDLKADKGGEWDLTSQTTEMSLC